MHRVVFFFKTPYFIIIHLTFITVTRYEMYVHSIHFRGCTSPHPLALAAMMGLVCARAGARRHPPRSSRFGGCSGRRTLNTPSAVPATPSGTFRPCFLKGTRRLALRCSRCRGVSRRRLGGCPPPARGPCTGAPAALAPSPVGPSREREPGAPPLSRRPRLSNGLTGLGESQVSAPLGHDHSGWRRRVSFW